MKLMDLGSIRIDGGTQAREAIDQATVDDYAEAMLRLETFPPVVVYHDGANTWLADGFHRWHAAKKTGVQTLDVEWRVGTVEMARLYAASANKSHGLKRTAGDKRRAIEMVLSTPECRRWKQEQIAKHCGVARSWVAEVMGKCRSDTSPSQKEKRAAVEAAVTETPEASNREIAKRTGVDHKTVGKVRAAAPQPPPSARRSRPPASYSSAQVRDVAEMALRFEDPDWNLMVAQRPEPATPVPDSVRRLLITYRTRHGEGGAPQTRSRRAAARAG
jgi:hypothetical protein